MNEPKERDEREGETLYFRTALSHRKRVQTAEGWRRTMLKMRDERRKKAKPMPKG